MLFDYFLDAFKFLRDFKVGKKYCRTISSIEISNFIDHVIYNIRFYGVVIVGAINVPDKLSVINLLDVCGRCGRDHLIKPHVNNLSFTK